MNLHVDEEVSLTARDVRPHGPDCIRVNGQATALLPLGAVRLVNFPLLEKPLTVNFAGRKTTLESEPG